MNSTLSGLGGIVLGLIIGALFAPYLYGSSMMGNGWGMMNQWNMMSARGGMGVSQNIDRHFIEQMIPHHEGAIAMAELALERSTRQEVRGLAEDIIEAQTQEIANMTAWYKMWYGSTPTSRSTGMLAHQSLGDGGMHMEGMEGDVDELRSATDFDKEFLSQMIVHHEMAIMMAQMLAAGTERVEMKTLADNIITSQSDEIELMEGWLQTW